MRELELDELKKLNGGGISPWIFVGVAAFITFAAGVLDGYVRPLKCNKRASHGRN